jgi:hypothetical protein
MANVLVIIAAGVFAAGIAVGVIAVVSIGIRREERRFRQRQRLREEQFFLTGGAPEGFMTQDAPDHVTWGARRLTNLYVRRSPMTEPQDPDLLVR